MQNKIRGIHVAWFLVTILFLVIRFQNLPGVFSKDGVILNDTDPYYRLHRIETMLKEHRFYPLHDDRISYPQGQDVPWPTGLDILIALPLWLYHSTQNFEIESFGAVVIPFLSLPLLWCAGVVAMFFGSTLFALMIGLLVALAPSLIYQTGLGRLDHHFLEAMIPMVFLMFLLKFHQSPKRYYKIWIIFILGLAPSFFPEGWIIGALATLAFLFAPEWNLVKEYSKIFFYAFLISLVPLSFSDRFFQGTFEWVSFSWWSPWVYLCGAVFFEIQNYFHQKSKKKITLYPWILSIFLFSVFIFLSIKNGVLFFPNKLIDSMNAVGFKEGIISTTQEAQSPFKISSFIWKTSDLYMLIVSSMCLLFFFFKRKHLYLVGFSLIVILLALTEIRFMAMAMPFMILILLLFFQDLIEKLHVKAIQKQIILVALTIFLIVPFRPIFHFYNMENSNYYFPSVKAFSTFLNEQFVRLHREKKDQAILAHWDYGHWLLYYTGLPVIADPFQGSAAKDVLDLLTSSGTEQLEPFLQKYPATFLVVESGADRSLHLLQNAGKDENQYFERAIDENGQTYIRTNSNFEDLFLYRFFFELGLDSNNNHPQHWRLIYISPYFSQFDTDISAMKAFERVPGLTVHAHTQKQYSDLFIRGHIYEKHDLLTYSQKASGSRDFTWVVPYGLYDQGNVSFDGLYTICNLEGKALYKLPMIQEKQVLEGDSINIQF